MQPGMANTESLPHAIHPDVLPGKSLPIPDNDPKHTSKYIQQFFQMNHINWWKSPAESPDLNPIEKVWGSMKTYLRDKHKPRNLGELKEGLRTYWKKLTPEVCTRYIDHLQKVMPVVVKEQGAPSGH